MSLVRWSPMWEMFPEMEEMMNRLPMNASLHTQMKSFVPAMDMYETDQAIMVETSLPGINPDDVQVQVEKGMLTVKGETKKEHEVDEKNYYRKEVRTGNFYREVPLPSPVLEDQVSAEFENGLLRITCPKAQSVAVKKVNIKIIKKDNGKK